MKTEYLIKQIGQEVIDLLLEKNKAYGDTAKEGILARIDDKLSRIKQVGINDKTEDTMLDLIGYLILYRVQIKKDAWKDIDYSTEGRKK
jgi:hypothetical protein